MKNFCFPILFVAFASTTAIASDMKPLGDLMRNPEQVEPSYPYVRCAGLYLAIVKYAGETQLGGNAETYKQAIVALSSRGAVIRSNRNGGRAEAYADQVFSDAKQISSIYVERMKSNYEASGQALVGDDLVKRDASLCGELTKDARTGN